MRLRDALSRALQAILVRDIDAALKDPEFLRRMVHDIVVMYVQADIDGKGTVKINVPPEMKEQFAHFLLQELVHKTGGMSFNLKGTLAESGFEYEVNGATVEVTQRSVVEALSDLVGPAFREIVSRAAEADKA